MQTIGCLQVTIPLISVNYVKAEVVVFGSKAVSHMWYLDSQETEQVQTFYYFGLLVPSMGCWNKHFESILAEKLINHFQVSYDFVGSMEACIFYSFRKSWYKIIPQLCESEMLAFNSIF